MRKLLITLSGPALDAGLAFAQGTSMATTPDHHRKAVSKRRSSGSNGEPDG